MPEKKRFLKSVTVNFISLVDRGANRKTIIYKSANTSENSFNKTIELKKFDEDQHMVYGIVYSPGQPDTDGDFTTAEVIKQMAYEFMKNRITTNVDYQHDYNPDEGFVAESWLIEKNDPRFPNEIEGSWAVGIKVTNDATWQKIKQGEITGLSMAGIAEVEPFDYESGIQKQNPNLSAILKTISRLIKNNLPKPDLQKNNQINNYKNEDTIMTPEEINLIVQSAVTEAMKSFTENKNDVKTQLESIDKRLKIIEEDSPGSIQDQAAEDVTKRNDSYNGPNWLS